MIQSWRNALLQADMKKDVLKLVENWLMRGPDELHRRIPDGLADAYSGLKGFGKQKGGQKGKGSDKGKSSDKGSWAWSDPFMPAHVIPGYQKGSPSENPEYFQMRQELERLRGEDRRRREQDEEDRRRREQDEEDRRRREQDEEGRRRREQEEEERRRKEEEDRREADRRRQERDERQRQEDLQRMRELQETDGTRQWLEPDRGRSEPDTTMLSEFERREALLLQRQEALLRQREEEMDRREEEMEREMGRSRMSDHRPRHRRNWDAEDWRTDHDDDWSEEPGWRWGRYRWWCRMCQWRTCICCQTAANGRTYQPQAAEEQTIGPDLIAKKKFLLLCANFDWVRWQSRKHLLKAKISQQHSLTCCHDM